METAYLSNEGNYTLFKFRDKTIKFLTSKNLEKYTAIVEWDKGYLVVMSKNYNQEECEDYIDLVPILRNLYMDVDEFLRDIKGVEIKYVWKRIKKIADDAGNAMQKSMAIVVSVGLLYSTLMTLIIVPIMYDILYRHTPKVIDVGSDLDVVPDEMEEL